jgi:hypothetical protein
LIVPAGFCLSVVLHALWDWLPLPGYWDYAWFVLVGLAGIFILRALVRRAVDEEGLAATRLNPDLIEIRTDRPRLTCDSCGQTCPPGTHYCVRCGSALRRA